MKIFEIKIIPIFQLLAGCFVFLSCSSPDEEITVGKYRITYKAEVEDGLWFGSYKDADGNDICVCDEPYQQDGWIHSFATNDLPMNLIFEVTSEFYEDSLVIDKPDVTASIFINGELQETLTNSMADGRTRVTVEDDLVDFAR